VIGQWTVEGVAYASVELVEEFHRQHLFPSSYVAVCPWCARVWATLKIDREAFYPLAIPCAGCPDYIWSDVPGSLWARYNSVFNAALPDALVEREYNLHLAKFLKETDHAKRDTLEREAA
jgi:hypothetical protein